MFKMFPDDANCPCGKNMNDVANGKVSCQECIDSVEQEMAQRTVLQHIWEAAKCFFNFQFLHCLAELKWAQERASKTGDYDPKTGKYYKKGYLKDE